MKFNVENYLSNLSYINKDFESLWNEILETVPKLTNKWLPSEANESDPLVVLLKELAIFADKLNYNIDKNILERFPATLTQLRSAYDVYESLGYTPDWYVSAVTSITITYGGMVNGARLEGNASTITIPLFTQVSDNDSEIIYTLLESIDVTQGTPKNYTVAAIEGTMNDFEINGTTQITYNNLDSQNRLFFTQTNIAQNGIIISNYSDFSDYSYEQLNSSGGNNNPNYEDLNKWRRVENLNQYTSGNRIYKLGIDTVTNNIYIQFPDDIGNLIGNGIYIKYILSNGSEGNIGRGDITQFINVTSFNGIATSEGTEVPTLATSDFVVTNTKSTQNGTNPLNIEEMREQFNRTVGVFNTLVTVRDYENYIYEYTDADGNHLVSNIRVSDRLNDLNDSITYKTMNTQGTFYDITENLNSSMTAYDLRLYPLQYVTPIETKEDLDSTFTTNGDEISISNYLNNIENAIADSKCISHNYMEDAGTPILVPYDLNGQIYLQTAVSTVEAAEIASKVETKIYQTLNSRELEWGDMVDYVTVVDNIKAADNRIQYVALDAISYREPELPNTDVNHNLNVIVRNILKGNKSWTQYNQFLYDYNEIETGNYGVGEKATGKGADGTDITGTIESINSIETNITGLSTSATSYTVGKNETLTVLIPQYNTITTYGNYLYFIVEGPETTPNPLPANTPYILGENQNIYIFETRDAAEAFSSGSSDYSYKLGPGTIIKGSVDIEFPTPSSGDGYINMGSSITIDVLSRAEGILRTSNNIASNIDSSAGLLIATNSSGLIAALEAGNNTEYTLLSDEYLFYTDNLYLELGIIGEGTTLSINNSIDIENSMKDNDVTDILNGSTLSNSNFWTSITSNGNTGDKATKLSYKLNELYTFGENYLISFIEKTGSSATVNLNNAMNKFTTLSGVTKITYELPDEEDVQSLTPLLSEDSYQLLLRLSLITGVGIEQELQDNQQVIINANVNTGTNSSTINFPTINSGNFIQSSMLISYQGGTPLSLVGNEATSLSIYSYEKNPPEGVTGLNYNDSGFITLSNINTTTYPINLNIPGKTQAVIPYITANATSEVKYMLVKNTAVLSIDNKEGIYTTTIANSNGIETDISAIGKPYVVSTSATYYNVSSSSNVNISDLVSDDIAIKLDANHIYNIGYSPIYQPTEENSIGNPTTAPSYFLEQHPYNRYVLPQLANINISISPLSITR